MLPLNFGIGVRIDPVDLAAAEGDVDGVVVGVVRPVHVAQNDDTPSFDLEGVSRDDGFGEGRPDAVQI